VILDFREAKRVPLARACLFALVASGGCSASDDVGGGNVSFMLPITEPFEIHADPNDPQWWPPPREGVLNVPCRGSVALIDDCCQLPSPEDPVNCKEYPVICDSNNACALAFDYSVAVELNLGRDVPALEPRRTWVLAKATLATIESMVDLAGLPVQAAELYVAPEGILSARGPGATRLASIPLMRQGQAEVAPEAQLALSSFLVDFNTPFNLIVLAHVVEQFVPADAVATIRIWGRVDASF
jgi:hypothetical protein